MPWRAFGHRAPRERFPRASRRTDPFASHMELMPRRARVPLLVPILVPPRRCRRVGAAGKRADRGRVLLHFCRGRGARPTVRAAEIPGGDMFYRDGRMPIRRIYPRHREIEYAIGRAEPRRTVGQPSAAMLVRGILIGGAVALLAGCSGRVDPQPRLTTAAAPSASCPSAPVAPAAASAAAPPAPPRRPWVLLAPGCVDRTPHFLRSAGLVSPAPLCATTLQSAARIENETVIAQETFGPFGAGENRSHTTSLVSELGAWPGRAWIAVEHLVAGGPQNDHCRTALPKGMRCGWTELLEWSQQGWASRYRYKDLRFLGFGEWKGNRIITPLFGLGGKHGRSITEVGADGRPLRTWDAEEGCR